MFVKGTEFHLDYQLVLNGLDGLLVLQPGDYWINQIGENTLVLIDNSNKKYYTPISESLTKLERFRKN